MMQHPLDRPVWNALASRQRNVALGDDRARRYRPDLGLFGAAADGSHAALAALAALVPPDESLGLVEAEPSPLPEELAIAARAACEQRVLRAFVPGPAAGMVVPLVAADAPAMLELATLTHPGPFFANTHRLGRFVGIRQQGRLVAMAGERMRLDGFCEVSGVCTHPDHQGKGYGATLIRDVAAHILDRGDVPFLHSYAANAAANALYARLGFALRRVMTVSLVVRADAGPSADPPLGL